MTMEIRVPQMGESIGEATIVGWRFDVGQVVSSGETLVDLETDKVTVEVPAPEDSLLKEIHCQTGEVVKVGQLLATMEKRQIKDAPPTAHSSSATPLQKVQKNDVLPPAAARLATEENINVDEVQGSGIRGQVTKADLLRHLQEKKSSQQELPQTIPTKSNDLSVKSKIEETFQQATDQQATQTEQITEQIVPLSSIRRRIAERLLYAQQTAAILTTFNEIDMQTAIDLRQRYKELFQQTYGVGLGYMSIFSKAVLHAIQAVPIVNAEIRDQNIVYKNYCNIGVAVGGPRGLVVPVIKGAERMSFAEIEQEIVRLAQKVKEGSISLEELDGGTFTISNGGIYGSMLSTPILNPPQSGILGMHNIVKRPVVINDQIVIRPIMYVAFSYDHRIIDGKDAVTFLVKVKEAVENPERMLLAV